VLEVDEGVFRPGALAQLISTDQLARPLEQHRELQRLLLNAETRAGLAKLA
jgi:hypothetical protein